MHQGIIIGQFDTGMINNFVVVSQQQTFLISGTHYICRYQSVSLFTETVHEILYQGSPFVLEM